jgi:O-antigen/teichoic acid export membrane protein
LIISIYYKDYVNTYIFHNIIESSILITLLLISFIPIAFFSFFSAILNGKNLSIYVASSIIIGSLISILLLFLLNFYFNKWNIYFLIFNYCMQFFIIMIFIIKFKFFMYFKNLFKIDKKILSQFLKFLLYAVLSSLLIPIFHLNLRNNIVFVHSEELLSIWFSNSRFSEAYMQFFVVVLTAIYFPKFVNSTSSSNFYMELKKIIIFTTSSFLILLSCFYFFSEFLINLVFNEDYMESKNYFNLQLISDFFRLNSYVPTIYMLAKRKFRLCIAFEFLQLVLLLISYFIFDKTVYVNYYYIFMYSYVIYFILVISFILLIYKHDQ